MERSASRRRQRHRPDRARPGYRSDNNHITIEGSTRLAFSEDVAARFLGYGWNVLRVGDANDIDRIELALATDLTTTTSPLKAARVWRSARTWRRDFWGMDGTFCE